MAVQMLYQRDVGKTTLSTVVADFRPGEYIDESRETGDSEERSELRATVRAGHRQAELSEAFSYARNLVEGTLEHLEEIDDLLRRQTEHWRLERMPAVDRNILRLAVYELLYEADVPKLVVLDEAIELAKAFGSEQSGRFVNGVLDGILRSQPLPGSLT
jgi:N utilization substance protein B